MSKSNYTQILEDIKVALNQFVEDDREAVELFSEKHQAVLSKKVIREVNTKLQTGLKNPK